MAVRVDVSRPEPAEGVRSKLISGRVRVGAAEPVCATAVGGRATGVRGVVTDGVAGRVTVGVAREVPGVRVTVVGGWATGARGVVTDGVARRVTVGVAREVPSVRVTVVGGRVCAVGDSAGRCQVTDGRGGVAHTGCG